MLDGEEQLMNDGGLHYAFRDAAEGAAPLARIFWYILLYICFIIYIYTGYVIYICVYIQMSPFTIIYTLHILYLHCESVIWFSCHVCLYTDVIFKKWHITMYKYVIHLCLYITVKFTVIYMLHIFYIHCEPAIWFSCHVSNLTMWTSKSGSTLYELRVL